MRGALNDAVITAGPPFRMIELELSADSESGVRYSGDGVIVATASGSTAYNVSAGGPIIYPTINSICLTPICPHTLTNRPLIIPAEMGVRVVSKAMGEEAFLTVDGQIGSPLEGGDADGHAGTAATVAANDVGRLMNIADGTRQVGMRSAEHETTAQTSDRLPPRRVQRLLLWLRRHAAHEHFA